MGDGRYRPRRRAGRARRGWLVTAGTVLATACGLLVSPGPAAAVDGEYQINVVLDISGSMNEAAGGGLTKIAAARGAVRAAVTALPEETQLGLRTFGGCGTSTAVVPIGALDRPTVIGAVDAVRPAGDTPLAYAMEQGGKDFTAPKGRKSMIVVSDGEETCQGDPVAAARALAANCVDVRVDVIGFKVDERTRQQLSQVAAAGCGQYIDVADSAVLTEKLERMSLRALRPVPVVGTEVAGTPTPPGAPTLTSGVYRDVMSNAELAERHWALDLPEGATAHVSVTFPGTRPIVADRTADNYDAFWLEIYANPDLANYSTAVRCNGEGVLGSRSSGGGAATVFASTRVTTGGNRAGKEKACAEPGKRWIKARRPALTDTEKQRAKELGIVQGQVPVEITVLIEPRVTDAGPLPPAVDEKAAKSDLPTINVSGPTKPILGGGAFGDAPTVGSGIYSDSLRGGEEVYFRVPVDWGQQLLTRTRFTGDGQPSTVSAVEIYNPHRAEAFILGLTSDKDGNDRAATVPVRYLNRSEPDAQSHTDNVATPGDYYVRVSLPAGRGFDDKEYPFELDIQVVGEVSGTPKYATGNGTSDPGRNLRAAGGNAGRIDLAGAVTIGAAGAALGLVVAVLIFVLLRRRRRWQP